MSWSCHCGRTSKTPEALAEHQRTCAVPVPASWYDGWQGVDLDGLPRAGRDNYGPTPPGQVMIGWRDALKRTA